MSKLADKVQQDLIRAIDQDELVLPTLPEVALQVREAAEDPDVSIQALSKVIGNDAALTARIIRVVNSPLLRSPKEITDLQMAISRLGINYTCNLATGLAMEQMFQATTDVVDRKMREVWNKSTEIAGICHVLARHYTRLAPDQATLAGLVHQIGVLPILTYAEDHNELLSDSISLSHVIERIHPLIGERILKAWDFPAPIAEVPRQHLDFTRNSPRADYSHPTELPWQRASLYPPGLEPDPGVRQARPRADRRHEGRRGPLQRPGSSHQHAAIGPPYSAGKRTRTSKPPSSPWSSWICARCARQTSPTIASPRPLPGLSPRR